MYVGCPLSSSVRVLNEPETPSTSRPEPAFPYRRGQVGCLRRAHYQVACASGQRILALLISAVDGGAT